MDSDIIILAKGDVREFPEESDFLERLWAHYAEGDTAKINGKWYFATGEGFLRGPYVKRYDALVASYRSGHQIDSNKVGPNRLS